MVSIDFVDCHVVCIANIHPNNHDGVLDDDYSPQDESRAMERVPLYLFVTTTEGVFDRDSEINHTM